MTSYVNTDFSTRTGNVEVRGRYVLPRGRRAQVDSIGECFVSDPVCSHSSEFDRYPYPVISIAMKYVHRGSVCDREGEC